MNAADAIKEMQTIWAAVTGQQVHPRLTERLFFEAWRMEITPDDLRCVLEYMLRYNRENVGGAQFRINVQKILGDLETFASTLAEARAKERNRRPAPTPREQVQALRERPVDPEQASTLKPVNWQSVRDVLKNIGEKPDAREGVKDAKAATENSSPTSLPSPPSREIPTGGK